MASAQEQLRFRAHWKCLLGVTLMSMGPFLQGLDSATISGLQAMVGFLQVFGQRDPTSPIGYNINHTDQQLIASLVVLGSFVASGTAGFTAVYVGRKMSLWIACVLCFIATAVMQTTTSMAGLMAGRFFIGIANGLLATHSQLWITECIPAVWRGLAVSALLTWTGFGAFIGAIVDNFTASIPGRASYQIPLGVIYIVPGIQFLGMFFIPESPCWLLEKDRDEKAARALTWLRPKGWRVSEEMAEMKAAIEAERRTKSSAGVLELFRNPVDRRRTFLACAGVTTQAASGSMYILVYGTYFFTMSGIKDPFTASSIQHSVSLLAVLVNSFIIARYGRRRVFLTSGLILCGITQLIIAAVWTAQPGPAAGKLVTGMTIIYILSYYGAISSYAWVSGSEIPSQRLRSHTFGFAVAIGFLGAWLTTFTAPYFINRDALNWGPKYGWVWAPSCFLTALWVFLFLPELKNRTFEEIDEMFEAKLPARKFRKYKCTATAVRPASSDHSQSEKSPAQDTVEDVEKS